MVKGNNDYMKNKIEKIIDNMGYKWESVQEGPPDESWPNEDEWKVVVKEKTNEILKTIYEEINKKRPKERIMWKGKVIALPGSHNDFYNTALSDYDRVLKEIFEK